MKDTYTVPELLFITRKFLFFPTNKTDAYYKMSNGEWGYFCGKVKEVEIEGHVIVKKTEEGTYLGPCNNVDIDVTIKGNNLYVR